MVPKNTVAGVGCQHKRGKIKRGGGGRTNYKKEIKSDQISSKIINQAVKWTILTSFPCNPIGGIAIRSDAWNFLKTTITLKPKLWITARFVTHIYFITKTTPWQTRNDTDSSFYQKNPHLITHIVNRKIDRTFQYFFCRKKWSPGDKLLCATDLLPLRRDLYFLLLGKVGSVLKDLRGPLGSPHSGWYESLKIQ